MKIPKYIEDLIERRVRAAKDLQKYDRKLTDWLISHNIPVDDEDYLMGYEVYTNPKASAQRILTAILDKE